MLLRVSANCVTFLTCFSVFNLHMIFFYYSRFVNNLEVSRCYLHMPFSMFCQYFPHQIWYENLPVTSFLPGNVMDSIPTISNFKNLRLQRWKRFLPETLKSCSVKADSTGSLDQLRIVSYGLMLPSLPKVFICFPWSATQFGFLTVRKHWITHQIFEIFALFNKLSIT